MKMSKAALALSAAMILAPITSALADETPGWYVAGALGFNYAEGDHIHDKFGDRSIDYDPGFSFEGSGGYIWTQGWRVEGEAFHSRSNVKKIQYDTNTNGQLENTDLFMNGYYDWNNSSIFTPYVGVGAGLALATADKIGTFPGPRAGYLDDSTRPEFAYQGIVGVSAQLDPNWSLTADYRYIATEGDPKMNINTGGSSYVHDAQHDFLFGVRYSFGRPAPVVAQVPPPAPLPRPVPQKPVVAPVPQAFMVFFDFDKSTLTPEAKRILASAAQEYKRGGYVRVEVTGHTDTMGTNKYNESLSIRRANAVGAELERLGVPHNTIAAKGVGKDGLMVPTADQVREAQNRRAEIVLDRQ